MALNSSTRVFTLKVRGNAVPTYTIAPAGYAEQQGENLIAGAKDATIMIKAVVDETDEYEGLESMITITIGAGSAATLAEAQQFFTARIHPQISKNLATRAYMNGNKLVVDAKRSGYMKVQVLDITGRNIVHNVSRYMTAGTNTIDLSSVPHGFYIVTVKDGSKMQTVRWRNK